MIDDLERRELCRQLIDLYTDEGRYIEVGWIELGMSAREGARPEEVEERRRMFFLGAAFMFRALIKKRGDLEFFRMIREELCVFSDQTVLADTSLICGRA
ncbi:hypothetical protein [Bradyrhizobium neotropicale]|uniref:hypothetical protein n=1 Tax=Bradyrhizobium neotropicale TaxID=1497615 RepID=UPI001AD662D2|nr:hypothetical protein [Bradyrhizobium neotropicale]MBO4228361.1 hypothetical protein [Bradyrhizobium neotropicale]